MRLFEHVANGKRCFSILSHAWDKEKIPSSHEESILRPSDSTSYFVNIIRKKSKFLSSHEESNVFTKHDANDIADPSSIQDVCRILTS